jgi:hypothetical protein
MAQAGKKSLPGRKPDGSFAKGVSGNVKGRPKGAKNKITAKKQELELAVRDNISDHQISMIVQAMVAEAQAGNVQAAKLILDKTISNAKLDDGDTSDDGKVIVQIDNLTLQAITPDSDDSVIDI